jgi:hypothetical protein
LHVQGNRELLRDTGEAAAGSGGNYGNRVGSCRGARNNRAAAATGKAKADQAQSHKQQRTVGAQELATQSAESEEKRETGQSRQSEWKLAATRSLLDL